MPEQEIKIESKPEEQKLSEGDWQATDEEKELLEKWQKRFKRAKEFREPFLKKWQLWYEYYRAYRNEPNYAYETKLMPPTAFKIIETLVSRLAVAKRKVRILPREKKDVASKSIGAWDDLIHYDFDILQLRTKLKRWLKSAGTYGNGIAKAEWQTNGDYDDPKMTIVDLWDILPAPETEDYQEDCPWLIHRIVTTKEKIERSEKARAEAKLEKIFKNLEFLTPTKVEDWKKERYQLNAEKMGQIKSSTEREIPGEIKISIGEDKATEPTKQIELWECWDYEEQRLIVIGNQKVINRDDENPYQKVNNGKIFIDLPDHQLNWELWALGHIEPVATTIKEYADLRNQRMDGLILTLDPVVKIKKEAGIDKTKIIFEPGAQWEVRKMDDIAVERFPEGGIAAYKEAQELKDEIEEALALSEYMQGIPRGGQEPAAKVALLLGQGNLRLGSLADNLAEALTRLVNILVDLNREFISEDKLYRVVGDEVDFKTFTKEDKEVKVDAIVEVEPIIPPDPETRLNQVLMLYDKLVAEDKPDPANPEEVKQWRKKKRVLQEMILDEMDYEAYADLLLGEEEPEPPAKPTAPTPAPEIKPEEAIPAGEPTPSPIPTPPLGIASRIMAKIPFLRREK